ncbi:hypothetical protein R3P38DRAFT_3178611 [Favolaschia claudopus]|uniref:Uncharacterized protein n=1 Tax=Favolaschia claudopus TaxID=2862362 RepID=A0AAW0CSH3_9AGAR
MVQLSRFFALLAVASVGIASAASTQRSTAVSYTVTVTGVITGIKGLDSAINTATSAPTKDTAVVRINYAFSERLSRADGTMRGTGTRTAAVGLGNTLSAATNAVKSGGPIAQADAAAALKLLEGEEPTIAAGLAKLAAAHSALLGLGIPEFKQILCAASKNIVAQTSSFIGASKTKLQASQQGEADQVGANIESGFPGVLAAYNC